MIVQENSGGQVNCRLASLGASHSENMTRPKPAFCNLCYINFHANTTKKHTKRTTYRNNKD